MAEQRLIDANALLEKRRRFYDPRELHSIAPIASTCVTVDDIYRAPTIDAVPVVRCRECKHHRNRSCPMRSLDVMPGGRLYVVDNTDDNGFCYKGEKIDRGTADEHHHPQA